MSKFKDMAGLYSRRRVQRYLTGDYSPIDKVLSKHNLLAKYQGFTYASVLKEIYGLLLDDYQNEYVVKNEFLFSYVAQDKDTNNITLNEMKMGSATVDLAVLSDSSNAYEIKTALDTDARLDSQLNAYNKVFNNVYVIFPEADYLKYKKYAGEANLITYQNDGMKFEVVSEVVSNNFIDTNALMNILHKNEYMSIATSYQGEPIDTNDFDRFDVCKEIISTIPFRQLNQLVLSAIKGRKGRVVSKRINNFFFTDEYREFNQICLALNLNQRSAESLVNGLEDGVISFF